ncbi:MAG: hypothetical protein M0C28_38825 [Candidatus Moduliflexus flocculans]|nr:hypothetical protein [Candidatus Moduliflexus flocculans]
MTGPRPRPERRRHHPRQRPAHPGLRLRRAPAGLPDRGRVRERRAAGHPRRTRAGGRRPARSQENGLYYGERYRRPHRLIDGWDRPGFDDRGWDEGRRRSTAIPLAVADDAARSA